jgi:hypothetical protein
VLLLLQPLLQAWNCRNEYDDEAAEPPEWASGAGIGGLDDSLQLLWHLPVVLLQLATGAWQRGERELSLEALRAATAATTCLDQATCWTCEDCSDTAQLLLLQWLQLVQLVVPECGSSSSNSCSSLGGLPYTENREDNQSTLHLPRG